MISKLGNKYRGIVQNRHSKELLKGGSIAFIYRLLNMVLGYALMLVIVKAFGKDGIGSYNLVLAWASLLALVGSLGLNTSVVRFVAEYQAKGDHKSIRQLYRSMLRFTVPLGAALGLILFLSASSLATLIYDDAALATHFKLIAVGIPFLVVATINVEFIRGWKVIVWSELFRNLCLTVFALVGTFVGLYFLRLNYLPILCYLIGGVVAAGATTFYILKRLRTTETRELPSAEAPTAPFSFAHHLRISTPMILTSFIQLLNGRIDIIMLGWYHPTALVGVFGVAFKISVISDFMISALKTIAMPKISELYWTKDLGELRKMLRLSTRLIFFSGIPITIILMAFPETILGWIGEGFEEGATTLRIFAAAQFISATAGLVGAFMNMTGNQQVFTRLVGVATLVNIGLNLLLIPIYGMEGAAIGTLISTIIWNVGGAIYIYRKYRIATFYQPFPATIPSNPTE